MIVTIVGTLAVCVLAGSLFLVYGARRTSQVPSKAITVAFALIGATVILLALPRV